METSIYFVSYLSMGGHPSLSLFPDFLLLNGPSSFGSAVDEIEFYAHVDRRDRPPAADDELSDRFEKHLRSLPNAWFKRKKRRIELSYVSQLGFVEELILQKPKLPSCEQFAAACRELVSNIPVIRRKLKATDDFDFEAVLAHMKHRLERLPRDDRELSAVVNQLRAAQKLLP